MRIDLPGLRVAVASLLALAAVGCTDHSGPTNVDELRRDYSAARTPVEFTIGRLNLLGLTPAFPDGRLHLRDVRLSGPVSGDLTGTVELTLNANLDSPGGTGPAWGTVAITTSTGEWEGNLVGTFLAGDPGPPIQLLSRVVLHGPDGQKLKAECNETSSTSEILECSGEILNPQG